MDRCKRCKNELDFWVVFKSLWLNYRAIKCSFCGALQQHSDRNRYLGGMVILLTFIFTARFLFNYSFDFTLFMAYLLVSAIAALLFSVIAVQFMKFNILQTQRSKDGK